MPRQKGGRPTLTLSHSRATDTTCFDPTPRCEAGLYPNFTPTAPPAAVCEGQTISALSDVNLTEAAQIPTLVATALATDGNAEIDRSRADIRGCRVSTMISTRRNAFGSLIRRPYDV